MAGLRHHHTQAVQGWETACVLSRSVVSDFATPRTAARQVPLSMELSKQERWSGLPRPPPGDLPNPGIEPRSSALRVDSLPAEPQGKSKNTVRATEQIRDTGRLINKALAYVVLKAEESHDLWSQRSGE